MFQRFFCILAVAMVVSFMPAPAAYSATNPAALVQYSKSDSPKHEAIPADATPEQVKDLLAGMSDEQVRRLLIDELQKDVPAPAQHEAERGLAGTIVRSKAFMQKIRERLSELFSGAAAAPRILPDALRKSLSGEGVHPPGHLLAGFAVITVMWFVAGWFVRRRTASLRSRIEDVNPHAPIHIKLGRLFTRAVFDLFVLLCVSFITLVPYLLIFNEPANGRPVIFAWLAAMVVVEAVRTVARSILVPKVQSMRFLPLSDDAAQYIFQWVVRIAWVVAVGTLLSSLVRMARGSELVYLLVLAVTGFVVASMVSLLALWNKVRVANAIRAGEPETSLRYQLAGAWHTGVIAYSMIFWMFWVVALLVFGQEATLTGVITMLILPGYLLADWGTQRLVAFAADLADVPIDDDDDDDEEDGKSSGDQPTINRFQSFLSTGFRVLIMAASVFLLLRAWGVDIPIGRATVSAGIDTLLTLVLAYIFWVFISNYIENKLKEKTSGHDGGHGDGEGGGGPGGDRFATLLQLVKKFIFAAITVITILIVLSSLGVDIGPLIAGASVFGIAIGFGAQTLVKDIISGIFFLMDDAFRVGDYIETGSAMGTVEEITVRSLKLRHHLGFLYTIPFGSMKLVKNNTRDWSIMKLQYLVPFDTDIQAVKKIIKRINKEIRSIPELDEMMLSDIKSQGVKAMEEYGMRMRVKFMTKPGGQFTLRKLVLAKMNKYFAEAGIEFAKPRVSVHVPSGSELSDEERAKVAAAANEAIEKKKADGK